MQEGTEEFWRKDQSLIICRAILPVEVPTLFDLTSEQQARIEQLLAEMTLEEKMAQLTGYMVQQLMEDNQISHNKLEEYLSDGIGQIALSAGAIEQPAEKTAENINAVQRFLVEETRLGIPAIVDDDSTSGFTCMGATHFPQAIGMAATWSPELEFQMANIIRQQARAAGSHLMYSPVLEVARDPRWGRTEETLGEDPYLVARMATAFVRGLGGEDLKKGIIATLKHYVAYSFSEGGRNCAPVHVGPRELRDVFLFPFEVGVKEGQVQSVMPAYHEIDGVPCAASKELLTEILRDEWGFEGIVIADWAAIRELYRFHHTAADATEAGKQALAAGLDIEIPSPDCYSEGLIEAIRGGEFPEELVDRSVRRHLRLKLLLGLFDDPYVPTGEVKKIFDIPEHRAVAREAARHAMTLLKNEGSLLPLDKGLNSIAVVGPNAASTRNLQGDYAFTNFAFKSSGSDSVRMVSILDGIKQHVSPDTEVRYALGCDVMDSSTEGFDEALQVAADCDVVIAVVGGRSALHKDGTSGENLDRAKLDLPGVQKELLKALHETGKPIVAVLVNGRPLTIEWMTENIPAILEAWLPGEEGGNAVADVLFGDYNPGGKLPVSLLRTVGQAPMTYNRRISSSAEFGHYVETPWEPLYPFGHGLSYTKFAYSNLEITPEQVQDEEELQISCEVENVGERAGDEVVQLYIHDLVATVTRPRKELKGFQRITLKPGERKKLTFALPVELLSYHDRDMNLVVEPGEFEVMVGASSEDIRLEGKFELEELREVGNRCRFCTQVNISSL